MLNDEDYMRIAIQEALIAQEMNEVPVGAIVVDETGEIISKAHNLKETLCSPSAHAEHIAIEQASQQLNAWRLTNCTIFSTLEPCIMCAGLMHQARIKKCVFGAYDKKAGALGTLYKIHEDTRLNHNFEVVGGVLEHECRSLLGEFFKKKRKSQQSIRLTTGINE